MVEISPETNISSISDLQAHFFTSSGDINYIYVFGALLCVFLVLVFMYEIKCVNRVDYEKMDRERGEFTNHIKEHDKK
jgi:hypothetical protein